MSALHALALLGSVASVVKAHGTVQGIIAGGKWYQGYSPSFAYSDPPPVVIGWSVPEDTDNGFVDPDSYTTQNIICHKSATPAQASAPIKAGSIVELQWTVWPDSHHGPVIDYLAKCPGKCEDVDKTTLEFFKIDEVGLVTDAELPGTWGSDQLIANNNSWTVTIPKSIAPGNYVLRHEIIALHSAGNADGAQNYPQCINLEISGSGTETPDGTLGEALYKADDPGVLVNIYQSLSTYEIPGPTLIKDAVSMKQTQIPFDGVGDVSTATGSSAIPASSAAPISSAAPVSSGAPSSSASAIPSSSAGAISSSAAMPSSSAIPAPCTHTITLVSSSAGAISSSSSILSSNGASISSSAPAGYPAPASSSVAPVSASASSVPASSSSAAAYPTAPASGPGSDGGVDLAVLMRKIVKVCEGEFSVCGAWEGFQESIGT